MNSTLQQIKEAQLKVKSGADFPNYVQDLIQLGVKNYETYVSDGRTEFTGEDDRRILSEAKYNTMEVSDHSDDNAFKNYLQMHQQGKTDFPTFCKHAAETGVEKWRVDISQMTCTYFNKAGEKMLEEKIPGTN